MDRRLRVSLRGSLLTPLRRLPKQPLLPVRQTPQPLHRDLGQHPVHLFIIRGRAPAPPASIAPRIPENIKEVPQQVRVPNEEEPRDRPAAMRGIAAGVCPASPQVGLR